MRNDTPKLESAAVKARLVNPRDLVVALRLVKPDAPSRAAYTVKCPWCGAISLSVWWPGPGKTVIATCKADRSGRCGGGANKTYSPFDLIAKAEDWDVIGDFHTKVLPLADQIGRGATSSASVAARTATPNAPVPPPEPDDEVTIERLHPEWTPHEWRNLVAHGIDPLDVRLRDYLRVVRDGDNQPAALRPRLSEGFTVWLDTYGPDGEVLDCCEVYTGPESAWYVGDPTAVLANEIALRAISRGPKCSTSWPTAERACPKLYVAVGPIDFLRQEPEHQRRLLPILGVTSKTLPSATLDRFHPKVEFVTLLTPKTSQRKLAELTLALQATGRRVSTDCGPRAAYIEASDVDEAAA